MNVLIDGEIVLHGVMKRRKMGLCGEAARS
jgi:hypothetical protein